MRFAADEQASFSQKETQPAALAVLPEGWSTFAYFNHFPYGLERCRHRSR